VAKLPRPDTHTRLIRATEDLLRESGMAGTGIKDAVARADAPIGSLYHFFPGGKAQLVEAALEAHATRLPPLFERIFADGRDPAQAVRALFDTAAAGFDNSGADKGCAVGAVALDLRAEDKAIQRVCERVFQEWAACIAARLPWEDHARRQSFGEAVILGLEGAFVIARASRSGEPFRVAGKWLSIAAESANASSSSKRSRVSSKANAHRRKR